MIRHLKNTFAGLAVLTLAACASTNAGARGMAVAPINDTCPVMMDHEVDPSGKTVSVDGHAIGFCCDKCVGKFESWSDDKKASYVKNTVASKKK